MLMLFSLVACNVKSEEEIIEETVDLLKETTQVQDGLELEIVAEGTTIYMYYTFVEIDSTVDASELTPELESVLSEMDNSLQSQVDELKESGADSVALVIKFLTSDGFSICDHKVD